MPIWVKPCCTVLFWQSDRDSRRSGLRSRVEGIDKPIPEGLYSAKTFSEEEMPSFGVSVWTSLVPVVLMAMRAIAEMILPKVTLSCR